MTELTLNKAVKIYHKEVKLQNYKEYKFSMQNLTDLTFYKKYLNQMLSKQK